MPKTIIIAAVAVIAAIGLSLVVYGRSQKPMSQSANKANAYEELRNLALQSSRLRLNIPAPAKQTEAWGVIMDWGLPERTATVIAFSDGNASVYLSTGGGSIGGASHEAVRKAAQNMVALANDYLPQMRLTSTFPLPARGGITFYVRTDAGIFTASGPAEELSTHRHPLSRLGDAGQDVITQYRVIQDQADTTR